MSGQRTESIAIMSTRTILETRRHRQELARTRRRLIRDIESTGSRNMRDELIIIGQRAGLL